MFNDLKLKIGNYILRRAFLKSKHSSALISLSQAKKISLLFDAQNSESIMELKSLLKYFVKLNIDVDVLGFVNSKKNSREHISTLHINYFNLNDVDFWGIPKSRKLQSFLSKRYDFVVNMSVENSFPTKYLALVSKSKYRIGVDTLDADLNYDLIFKLKIKSLDYFIKNLIHYLELIDQNNEK